ncbi:MAG: hypothetical protein ACRDL5_15195, partial [Solirubrobacteraceae bacterium]
MAMKASLKENAGVAALVISLISLVLSAGGLAYAAHGMLSSSTAGVAKSKRAKVVRKSKRAKVVRVAGHRLSSKPYANGLLLLGSNKKFPASAIPTVKNSNELAGRTLADLTPGCPPTTVNLGTWCLEAGAYPVPSQDKGLNNYFWASQACVQAGGWLPTAAQLIGAAKKVRLESTLTDSPITAIIDEEPADGLKDQREMSATLTTTAAGSSAAGSEGVSEGSRGNPEVGESNPVPKPAVPEPETLQYVTVYSNGTKGGFAGSEP